MFDKAIQIAFHAVAASGVTLAAFAGIAQFVPASELPAAQHVQLQPVVITAKAIRG
jgi:hypothetical protein